MLMIFSTNAADLPLYILIFLILQYHNYDGLDLFLLFTT